MQPAISAQSQPNSSQVKTEAYNNNANQFPLQLPTNQISPNLNFTSQNNLFPTSPIFKASKPSPNSSTTQAEENVNSTGQLFGRELLEMFYNYSACRYSNSFTNFNQLTSSEMGSNSSAQQSYMPCYTSNMHPMMLQQFPQWSTNSSYTTMSQQDCTQDGVHDGSRTQHKYSIDKLLNNHTTSSEGIGAEKQANKGQAAKCRDTNSNSNANLFTSTVSDTRGQQQRANTDLMSQSGILNPQYSLMLTQQAAIMRQWQHNQAMSLATTPSKEAETSGKSRNKHLFKMQRLGLHCLK